MKSLMKRNYWTYNIVYFLNKIIIKFFLYKFYYTHFPDFISRFHFIFNIKYQTKFKYLYFSLFLKRAFLTKFSSISYLQYHYVYTIFFIILLHSTAFIILSYDILQHKSFFTHDMSTSRTFMNIILTFLRATYYRQTRPEESQEKQRAQYPCSFPHSLFHSCCSSIITLQTIKSRWTRSCHHRRQAIHKFQMMIILTLHR